MTFMYLTKPVVIFIIHLLILIIFNIDMPWGWECRAKLIKQLPAKPTDKRGPVSCSIQGPGPQIYEQPEIFCGKGYSRIKRAPAYTLGYQRPVSFSKPVLRGAAPMLDTSGMGPKGKHKIKHGTISPRIELLEKDETPGPGNYLPRSGVRYRRPPAYTMRPAAKADYKPEDMWTPSPNMYLPCIPGKRSAPAYSFGNVAKEVGSQIIPSVGTYEPNFKYVDKKKPAYSFGAPWRSLRPAKIPPPNTYCERKFMYVKRTVPAPSFGIRHTPYLCEKQVHLKPSKLEIVVID